jgi:hypothetical protein
VLLCSLFCLVEATLSICRDTAQYDPCSTNSVCGCFHKPGAVNKGVCGFLWASCSELVPCKKPSNSCDEPGAVCVQHPDCQSSPVCFPAWMIEEDLCPTLPGKQEEEN